MIKNLKAFTLIEVMVVLSIMAIITTVAVMALHLFNHARQVTIVAHELAQTIKTAENEALLRANVLGLVLDQQGYQFYELTIDHERQTHWKKLSHDKLSKPNAFHDKIQIKFIKPENNTYIVFSSSGDVSPFSLMITDRQQDRVYLLKTNQNGVIKLRQINPS